MDLKTIRCETDDGVALVTLDRPDRLNAWTARMEAEYGWVLDRAEADPDVRAVVVTGAGRGFCAGADFKALDRIAEAGSYDGAAAGAAGDELSVALSVDAPSVVSMPAFMSKPVLAAVNGPAAGVGFALMCFADLRFAAAGAKLTTSFASWARRGPPTCCSRAGSC